MKNKLYESILQNISNELKNDNENKNTAFHVFIDAMHGKTVYDTDGPCGDLNDALPALKVTEMGLMKMFQYKYSENDEYIKLLTELADKIHYSNFAETVCRNSIEAKKRYQDSHICKTYIVAGTCNWPCTIKATENGWSTEFGYDGNHEETVQYHTPQENFEAAYKWASEHYGKLLNKNK